MKGIFLYNKNIDMLHLSGIDKKVILQNDEFNKNGLKCRIVCYGKKKINIFNLIIQILLSKLPFFNGCPELRYSDEFSKVDFMYFRRPDAMSRDFINTLKKIKENNPKVKIIMEIPNYPYEDELRLKLINKLLVVKDRIFRKKLSLYIDRIAIQNPLEELYGIKTIKFRNGIDIESISVRNPERLKENEINICAVASLEPWQGYERVFEGLRLYYENHHNNIKILLHIAGRGSELKYYKRLVCKYNLDNYVTFYGRISGDGLMKLYDKCSLALDAFGRYKTNNYLSTSLKSREYLAKGLPIITGCKTDVLSDTFPYFLEFENNDTVVDFNKILDFYQRVYSLKNPSEVVKEIRKYAVENCDISVMIKPIVDYIKHNS